MVNRSLSKAATVGDESVTERRPAEAEACTAIQSLPGPPRDTTAAVDAGTSQQGGLGPDLQAVIGQQLRMVYHEVLNEPIPDRFVRLLEELAKNEGSGS